VSYSTSIQDVECSLWTAKIFPVLPTRKESCTAAVGRIQRIRGPQKPHVPGETNFVTVGNSAEPVSK